MNPADGVLVLDARPSAPSSCVLAGDAHGFPLNIANDA